VRWCRTKPFRPALIAAGWALLMGSCGLLLLGCGGSRDGDQSNKVKVCYIGLTCEPSIYVAYEKGFFKEEGLDVELIKSDWDNMRDGLALGRYDATHHLVMYLMMPVENGLDVKMTAGIHTGCLSLQAGAKTDLKKVEDLKGSKRKIGISHMGAPPFLFASRVLAAKGLNPSSDVEWVVVPSDAMELALDQGRVDAVANAEPIGTILLNHGKVRKLATQAEDEPYKSEYCCAVAINGKFAREKPKAAAAVTRALLRGARWVNENKVAAAKLAVEKGYLAATPELNAQAIGALSYMPGVSKCRQDLDRVAQDLKTSGFLKPSTDPLKLAQDAWLDLEGVTDDWIKGLKVEKVAGGGDPPRLDPAAFEQLYARSNCCAGGQCLGCCGELDRGLMRLTGVWAHVTPRRFDPAAAEKGETRYARAGH
jgi:NitT/TauT family transport system substrate-binding protein